MNLKTKLGRLRVLSLIEGLSLLILVFVAVPLKYMADSPMMVKVFGPIHGGLFLLFVFMVIAQAVENAWKFKTVALLMLSSIVPFGCFFAESKIFKPMAATAEV